MNIIEELRYQEKKGFLKNDIIKKTFSSEKNSDFKLYFQEIKDAVYILDFDGTIIEMNKSAYQRLGYKKHELVGKKISFINSDEFQGKEYNVLELLDNQDKVSLEITHITKEGKKIPVEIYVQIIKENQILAVARDISERKTEIQRYKTFFLSSTDALMTIAPPKWKFSGCNQSTLDLFNVYSEEEFTKLGPWDVSPETQPDGSISTIKAKKMINKAIDEGTCFFEWTHKRMNGVTFPANVLLTRVDFNGEKIIQATVRDLTLEKKFDEKIKENEQRLSNILEHLPMGILAIDAKTHEILEVNENAAQLIGMEKTQIIGSVCNDFICPYKIGKCTITDLHQTIDKGEEILIDKNKNEIKILKTVIPIRLQEKDVLLESFVNITEIDRAKKLIEKSKKQIEELLNAAGDGIRIINRQFEVIKINDTMANMVQKPKEELIGSYCWEMFGSDICGTDNCSMKHILKNGTGFEKQTVRTTPEGKNINCISKVTPYTDDKGEIIGIIEDYRDITTIIEKERKITEKNKQLSKTSKQLEYLMKDMQKTLNEYDQIFNNRSNAMLVLDKNFRILRMNDPFLKIFKIDKSKVLGKKYDEAFDFSHCNINNHIEQCLIIQQLSDSNNLEIEEKYNEKYYSIIGSPIFNEIKQIQGYVISFTDISEIREQNKKLMKLDELKSNFLNVTSHELRTPMSSIKGYVQMMINEVLGKISSEQSKALNVILRNTNRLDNLIQDILDISRLESGTMKFITEETNIQEMLEEIKETMSITTSDKKITIKLQIVDELPVINIDQYRIKQVIMNLINNSLKFSSENSIISIKAYTKDDNMIIEVSDKGRGIPKDKQKHVFETFYQVDGGMDRKFGGAGLGLAISRGIVLTHGGRIWVDSSGIPGEGTTFSFSLPNNSVGNLEERFKKLDMFRLD